MDTMALLFALFMGFSPESTITDRCPEGGGNC